MCGLDREELFEDAVCLVKKAGELLKNKISADQIGKKGKTDFVTDIDRKVQQMLKSSLAELDSSITFASEEQENYEEMLSGYAWILDPVDGTTNLIHSFHASAISLAFAFERKVMFGIVFNPFTDELYTAVRGKGAFLNGEKIRVSEAESLADSLCFAGTNPGKRDMADMAFARMRAAYERCRDIRRIGAASVEICYLADGRADGYFEHGLKLWDYAAASLILEEAGGMLTSDVGFCLKDADIAASNGKIHAELLSIL